MGFGYLIGDKTVLLKSISSGVAGKHHDGGQSQRRFERLREMHLNEFYNRVAEYARYYFLDTKKVKGLIIHGPAFTKHDFIRGKYLEYRLQNIITKTIDGCYAGEDGLYELQNMLKSCS